MLASARAQQSHTPPDAQRVWRSAPYKYGHLIEAFNQISLICPISLIVNYNLPGSPCPGSPAAKQTQTSISSSSWPQRRTLQHRRTWNHINKLQRKIFIANQPMPFVHFIKKLDHKNHFSNSQVHHTSAFSTKAADVHTRQRKYTWWGWRMGCQ